MTNLTNNKIHRLYYIVNKYRDFFAIQQKR